MSISVCNTEKVFETMRYGVFLRKTVFASQYLLGILVGHILISLLLSGNQNEATESSKDATSGKIIQNRITHCLLKLYVPIYLTLTIDKQNM